MNNLEKKDLINWPNAMSLSALLLAWLAIIILFKDNIKWPFALVLLAFIVDFADGWVARKLNQASDFGRILDSQVDIFIYLVYFMSSHINQYF